MPEFTRASGIKVSVSGPVTLVGDSPPTKGSARPPARGLATGAAGDGGPIIPALLDQGLDLIDTVPFEIPPAARPVKRGAEAPVSALTLDVPLGPDEGAAILLDDEGEYRWIVDGMPLLAQAPRRGARGTAATKRQVRFSVEVKGAPPAPLMNRGGPTKRGGGARSWLLDHLVGKVTAYVFRFAVKVAGRQVVASLERNVTQGLVAVTAADPQLWRLLGDDEVPPSALPTDRPERILLLLHGTFSSTVGSFGALASVPEGRNVIARALKAYHAVLGFDHPTLSVDPRENAAALLAALRRLTWPRPPHIDIIAFSRGGLVARSFIEQLLPASQWTAVIDRVVFVGCTNGGTQLAEPENWRRFADHYTTLALGAARALSLLPGAQGWILVAGQAVRGMGSLIKALASGVVSDMLAPGIAAMEPDGAFVKSINTAGAGPSHVVGARCYAVTSDFKPGAAIESGGTPELPPKFLMRIADWGADELYGEANDLVVHVRSMTTILAERGEVLEDQLNFGTDDSVYHTNYFTRERTAANLAQWLGLKSAATDVAATRDSSKVGPPEAARPTAAKPRFTPPPPPPDTFGFGTPPSTRLVGGSRLDPHDMAETVEVGKAVSPDQPLSEVVKRAVEGALPKGAGKVAQRGGVKTKVAVRAPLARGGRGRPTRKSPSLEADGGGGSLQPRPSAAPEAPAAATRDAATAETGIKIDCHFRAEIDREVVVDKISVVDVTVARHALATTSGRAGDAAAAGVEADKKLIVQLAARRNVRIEGERQREIDVPEPAAEEHLTFRVTALVASAEGEVWVQVRQGPSPLLTLKLTFRIVVERSDGPVVRSPVEQEMPELPPPEPPLDQLLIEETLVDQGVQYHYFLDLQSLHIRKHFDSDLLKNRDAYITRIMNDIGLKWTGTDRDQIAAFELDLKSIGARMFAELMPRDMRDLLWKNRERIVNVQVLSMEPFIPWELVYLTDPGQDTLDENSRFLGELGLVRWLYDGYPPVLLTLRPGRARYIIPDYVGKMALPEADEERRLLQTLFDAEEVPAKVLEVQNLVREPGAFDLLHFGGHAEAAGAELADARLLLGQSSPQSSQNALQATTVSQTARLADGERRPIVVLNACETARMSRTWTSMGGFAEAFVSRGAGVFVGTHWSVGDAPARTFIEAFYEAFAAPKTGTKRLPLGQAVAAARQAARHAGDATWLAYVVYGHPRAKVTVV